MSDIEGSLVCIPLFGIELSEFSHITLGNKTLRPIKEADIERMRHDQLCALMEVAEKSEQAEDLKQSYDRYIYTPIRMAKCCLEYALSGDARGKHEKFFYDAHNTVDILRYGTVHLSPPQIPINTEPPVPTSYHIGLEAVSYPMGLYIIPVTREGFKTALSIRAVSPRVPLVVTPEVFQRFEEVGVFSMALALAAGPTDYELLILRGIHWLSLSLTQDFLEQELVSLVTCLEVLFGPGKDEALSTAIAESVAMLLRVNITERLEVKSFIKRMYSLRSLIVHDGHVHGKSEKHYTAENIAVLRQYTADSIKALIEKRSLFAKDKDGKAALLCWLERTRLSANVSHGNESNGIT